MLRIPSRRPAFRLGALALLLAAGLAADKPTREVDAKGLVFTVPAEWKYSPGSNEMRRAELKVAPVKGDDAGAELVVFAFPGGAGGVEANISRWEKTFKDKDGETAKAEVKKLKGKNVDVTRVAIAGHYFPSSFPGRPKQPDQPNARLLGAIVLTDSTGYFLRLVGPEKTVSASETDFDKLIESLKSTTN